MLRKRISVSPRIWIRALNAHGVSVIEIRKGNGRDKENEWRVVRPSKYARRITGQTPIQIVGPAAGDPRVPRPQSEELYMALRQLGVPTEFYVYPGASHGIPDPRNLAAVQLAQPRVAAQQLGITRPASTWTYLVNDDPFRNQIGMMLTGPGKTTFAIGAALMSMPVPMPF